MQEKGNISIHTENIFPIIKKFLYSDHEIFLRELVSNAVDASQKLKKLAALGEFKGELGEMKVSVAFDKDAKTITIKDRGIGMTADEIKKYINQIAFSGATEFIEKYKGDGDEKTIIGHFGLGFYSAFMVAENVEIITLSHKEGSQAARWTCDGSTEFEITEAVKEERGTEIILHVAEDSLDFLDKWKLQGILDKYCKFLPVEIEFDGAIINKTQPLWTKQPSELKDEDYLDFYKELYPMAEEPLFWIHLNVDYPFNLTGILYFPKIKKEMELTRNKIQLFSRQVFITDEVKDVVPEFLMLLHGVLDSPDIPLNVSRSFLQADGNVKKINSHITKKVADKLQELFRKDRTGYEQKWEHIGLFVKYGMLSDDKFYDKAKEFCLLKNVDGAVATIAEYREKIATLQTDKDGNLVMLYTNDAGKLDAFVQSAKKRSYDVLIFDSPIDNHFIGFLEGKEEKTLIKRVDSDSVDKLIAKDEKAEMVLSDEEQNTLKEIFEKSINNPSYKVALEALPTDEQPVTVVMPEFMRRMKDMGGMGGMSFMGSFPDSYNVVVNGNHEIAKKILAADDTKKELLARHCFELGLLSQGLLTGPELSNFLNRSVSLLA
jgi:molecular chaperone HtpG